MKPKLFFKMRSIPDSAGEYVLWCDGMGTGRELFRSIKRATGFVFKVHMAFGLALKKVPAASCYPVMDGLYVTAPKRHEIEKIIRVAFSELAMDFIEGWGTKNMFMIRAGLAYGPVIHGRDIPDHAMQNNELAIASKRSILLSPAMVAAVKSEALAPPFGVFVDDTAKFVPCLSDSKDTGFQSNLYQWWLRWADAKEVATKLYEEIEFYLNKAVIHSTGMGYPKDRIEVHRELAREYFGGTQIKAKRERRSAKFEAAADHIMAEHGLPRDTALQIVRGNLKLEDMLFNKRMREYFAKEKSHSILTDAISTGNKYCFAVLGQAIRMLQVLRCMKYEVVVKDADGKYAPEETLHKVGIKFVCESPALHDGDVVVLNDVSGKVVSIENLMEVRDRYKCSDRQLFMWFEDSTPVVASTVEGDLIRGVLVECGRYEIRMQTQIGTLVSVFRHALSDIREQQF